MRIFLISFSVLLLYGCHINNEERIDEVINTAKELTYNEVFDITSRSLRSNKDSCLYFIHYSENREFEKAKKVVPHPISEAFILNNDSLSKEEAIHAAYENDFIDYNSLHILSHGEYYIREYNNSIPVYDIILKKSLEMNNSNIYALFGLIKLKLIVLNFNEAHVLMERFLSMPAGKDHKIIKRLYSLNEANIDDDVCEDLNFYEIITKESTYIDWSGSSSKK